VAGLRNRPADEADAPERESMSGTLDVDAPDDTAHDTAHDTELPEPAAGGAEPDVAEDEDSGGDADGDADGDFDEDQVDADDTPTPARRPAGKRRTAGVTRPADLTAAEAGTKAERAPRAERAPVDPRRRRATQLSVAVVLTVVAIVLAGFAVWFKGEADDLDSADTNSALTDSGRTSEVVGQLKSAIETTFSYNYTDLDSTQKAVDETLTGKARCEYDQLFGQVKQQAPKQKIIMVTAVRDIALVRLDGDRAEGLVFIDQSSTRADVNNSVAGEAQFAVLAHRDGDHWKITEFNMFDQPLVNGKPAPEC
jgi:Mce-associated membrane protein